MSFLHLGSLDVWQVFEFLFQNKYTADEDVDLEEVKAKGRCWGDFETHWDDLGTGRDCSDICLDGLTVKERRQIKFVSN